MRPKIQSALRLFMAKKTECVILALLFSSSMLRLDSCTIFTASIGNTVLFGNNEDWDDRDALIWVAPGTGTDHGAIYVGFRADNSWAQGGLNDEGLCLDATMIPEMALKRRPEKLRVFGLGQEVLGECATVEEVIRFIEKRGLSKEGAAQYLFADKNGNSIIVCPGMDGEIKIVRKEGAYQAITNFNILYPDPGRPFCWRYNTCMKMLRGIKDEKRLMVSYFASILEEVSQNHATYSTIYDLKEGIIYLYNQHNFDEVVVLSVEGELKKGRHTYPIPTLFKSAPEQSQTPHSQTPLTHIVTSISPMPKLKSSSNLNILYILVPLTLTSSLAAIVILARRKRKQLE